MKVKWTFVLVGMCIFTAPGFSKADNSTQTAAMTQVAPVSADLSGPLGVAFGSNRIVPLSEYINSTPKSVYVDGRYTFDNKNVFYINGKKLVPPEGDVEGFILSSDGGYYVGVFVRDLNMVSYQTVGTNKPPMFSAADLVKLSPADRLKALELMSQNSQSNAVLERRASGPGIVIYKVTNDGKINGLVQVLEGVLPNPIETPDALYYEKVTPGSAAGMELSYTGVDSNGKQVQGPQEVYKAFPTPDGWVVGLVTSVHWDLGHPYYHLSWSLNNNGQDKAIPDGIGMESPYDKVKYIQTKAVWIDEQPIADSWAYGYVLRDSRSVDPLSNGNEQDWFAEAVEVRKMSNVHTWHERVANILSANLEEKARKFAYDVTERYVLFPTNDGPKIAGQMNIRGVSGISYGVSSLGKYDPSPVYQMQGSGMLFGRVFFGGASVSDLVVTNTNDAIPLRTPKGTIIVGSKLLIDNKPDAAFDIAGNQVVAFGGVRHLIDDQLRLRYQPFVN